MHLEIQIFWSILSGSFVLDLRNDKEPLVQHRGKWSKTFRPTQTYVYVTCNLKLVMKNIQITFSITIHDTGGKSV